MKILRDMTLCAVALLALTACATSSANGEPSEEHIETVEDADLGDAISENASALSSAFLITDGVPIQNSASTHHWVFHSSNIYAPLAGGQRAFISSDPSGTGPIVVDNGMYVNGRFIDGLFARTFNDPRSNLGRSALVSYAAVEAIDVTNDYRADGQWSIRLVDYGYTYASSRLYLVIK